MKFWCQNSNLFKSYLKNYSSSHLSVLLPAEVFPKTQVLFPILLSYLTLESSMEWILTSEFCFAVSFGKFGGQNISLNNSVTGIVTGFKSVAI